VEKAILTSFEEIHGLNVIHGDVRPANIQVAEHGNRVWIIDFEDSRIVEPGDEQRESLISTEMELVHQMLGDIRKGTVSTGCLPLRGSAVSTAQTLSLQVC
jgi:RIO-like serine/threonine protein kinase